jgi:hypothetical protein
LADVIEPTSGAEEEGGLPEIDDWLGRWRKKLDARDISTHGAETALQELEELFSKSIWNKKGTQKQA